MPVTLTITGMVTTDPRAVFFDPANYNLIVSESVPVGYIAETLRVSYISI